MLKSESLPSFLKCVTARAGVLALLFVFLVFLTVPVASAQAPDFTLDLAPFPNPGAIAPGGTAAANITLDAVNGFTGSVNLSCTVTWAPQPTQPTPPTCEVSPPSRTPPGGASVTITSSSSGTPTTPLLYNITVTGTSSGITHSSSQDLTVLAVVPTFTITVQTTVVPSSVPAGQGGQGLISVNPVNGYSGNVTLSCATLTPLVSIPPYCTFTYPSGKTSLPVMNGVPSTSTVTITSFGPTTVMCANTHRWAFYALWLPLPLLTLVGFGRKRRKAWAVFGLFVMTGIFLLMPACGNTVTTTCTPNGVTPANSYSLTVTGVDEYGVISSNTGSSTTNPTVNLTVTAPKN
jgi:hypothetical protein